MKNSSRRLRVENLETRRLLAGDFAMGPSLPDGWLESQPADAVTSSAGFASAEASDQAAEGESVLKVRLDFSLDQSNFFTSRYPQARAAMQEAVNEVVARFNDTLSAINPPSRSEIQWQPAVLDPRTGALSALPQSFRAAANEIVVYVRGNNLTGLTRGLGGYNSFGVGYNCPDQACVNQANAFIQNLTTRGETGAAGSNPTDFAPVVGAITIDTRTGVDWYFGSIGSEDPGQTNFRALVSHEFAHVLGFGTAPSFTRYLSGSRFTGPQTNAVYPGSANVPMNGSSHFADSVRDVVPTTMTQFFDGFLSDLDFAALDDIGWEVAVDDRPTVQLTSGEQTVPESAGEVTLTASLSATRTQSISVPFTVTGNASANSDYTLSPSAFNFSPGQRNATVTVNIADDATNESLESVTVTLRDSTDAKLGDSVAATVHILDNDGAPVSETQLSNPEFSGTSITVPGNGQPLAFLFRASANTTFQVTKVGGNPPSEAFFVLDENLQPIGQYDGSGELTVSLAANRNYVLRFEARSTAEQYQVSSSAGYQAINNPVALNLLQPADVTGDGMVSALDALRVINLLNEFGQNAVNVGEGIVGNGNYYDVTGDGTVSSLDALRVINTLSEPPAASSESDSVNSAFAAALDSASVEEHEGDDHVHEHVHEHDDDHAHEEDHGDETSSENSLSGHVDPIISVFLHDHDHGDHDHEDHYHDDPDHDHDSELHGEDDETSSNALDAVLVDQVWVEVGASCLA